MRIDLSRQTALPSALISILDVGWEPARIRTVLDADLDPDVR